MRTFLLCAFLCLVGCNGSGKSAPQFKDVFSKWTNTTSGMIVNLTGGAFGVNFIMDWVFLSGAICQSTGNISGDESSGIYTMTNSTYISGGSGDPGCASINGGGTYTNSGTLITFCGSGGCASFD